MVSGRYVSLDITVLIFSEKNICIVPSFNAYFSSRQLVVYKRICLFKTF